MVFGGAGAVRVGPSPAAWSSRRASLVRRVRGRAPWRNASSGLGDAHGEISVVDIEAAAASVASRGDLMPVLRTGVPLDGVTAPAQVARDLPNPHTLLQQTVDQGMMDPQPRRETPVAVRCRGGRRSLSRGPRRLPGRCRVKAGAVRRNALLDGLAEVHPQMEAVGHLLGARCANGGALGIGSSPVTAHDVDAGVGQEPGRQRSGVPGGQHVDDLVRFSAGQHCGVGVSAFDREVVDTQHPCPRRPAARLPRPGHRPRARRRRAHRPRRPARIRVRTRAWP